jgi:hypothetical protein
MSPPRGRRGLKPRKDEMRIDYSKIPPCTIETLQAWIENARPMGGFCEAVVSNNLKEAFARADEDNIRAMFHIVSWMYNEAPTLCWGSEQSLTEWPRLLAERDDVDREEGYA